MKRPATPLLQLCDVDKTFFSKSLSTYALKSINLSIEKGETLGIAGESGCGKSTLGKVLLGLTPPSHGLVLFNGCDLNRLSSNDLLKVRQKMQVVFQNPYSSLNPKMQVAAIIGEGIDIHGLAKGAEKLEIIKELLRAVSLPKDALYRYPHEFSGGEKQRIAIARALAVHPEFIVCDEPISALDPGTEQHIMQLLLHLKKTRQMGFLFISHDLHAIRQISDQIAVMYCGKIVEKGPAEEVFKSPCHPYTKALIDAIPTQDIFKERNKLSHIINGEPPSPLAMIRGCPFHPRCPKAMSLCKEMEPLLKETSDNHMVACHLQNTSA